MKRILIALALMAGTAAAQAETPRQILDGYVAQATAQQANFTPSISRGYAFYRQRFGHNETLPSCQACHTDNPAQPGRHAVTGKGIRPLAPVANGERLSDPARVEKWFGRNCREVVGRACTPAEKADFVQFLMEVR